MISEKELISILENFPSVLPHPSKLLIQTLSNQLKLISFKKGDYFLQAGNVCKNVGLLSKGVLRVYYYANEREHTSYFNVEKRNPLVAAFTSFLNQEESIENIQALEDSTIYCLSKESLNMLYDQFPEMERFGRTLAEQNYLMAIERIYDLQQEKAPTKYDKFLQLYPGLINRIPHHYIASYLGITPESLSRVRKNNK